MIIVAAAGNEGPDAPPRYPAAFDGVIAVTAVDARGQVYERAARGPHIDFATSGVDVHIHDGSGGRYVTGTSIAAPFVTARIAADVDVLEVASAGDARKALAATARDLGDAGQDPVYGSGLAVLRDGCRG